MALLDKTHLYDQLKAPFRGHALEDLLKKRNMKVNVNHPSFISFIDNVTTSILSNINVGGYFDLSNEKKLSVQYIVFKLMKNSVKVRAKLTDSELRSFVVVLCKKNEEIENYEFAQILKDVTANFDTINVPEKVVKRTKRIIKTDNPTNG